MTRAAAAVDHHLRRLDAGACAALVADLWAARGYETRREGAVVVATRRGESRVLYPCPDARLRSPPAPDRPVDAVVDPRAGRRARRVADAHDARLLDAADLREMLWYGVESSVADDLCERHLGARPDALSPPLRRRLRSVVGRAESGVATALVAALVLLVVGALVVPALSAPPGTDAGGDGRATDGSDGVDLGAATASRPSGPSAVPGLDEGGIDDLTALQVAHRRAVQGRSYALWIDYRGPAADDPTKRVHRDVDITVDDREYVAVTTLEGVNGTPTETVYRNPAGWYVRRDVGGNVTYRQVGGGDSGPYGLPDPGETQRTLVRRYLTTPETRLGGTAERNGRPLYRVVAAGNPFGFGSERIGNYTANALITPDGFVVHLEVTYTVPVGDGRAEVDREWTYGWIDKTAVGAPGWYERRFGDGTADEPDAGDD